MGAESAAANALVKTSQIALQPRYRERLSFCSISGKSGNKIKNKRRDVIAVQIQVQKCFSICAQNPSARSQTHIRCKRSDSVCTRTMYVHVDTISRSAERAKYIFSLDTCLSTCRLGNRFCHASIAFLVCARFDRLARELCSICFMPLVLALSAFIHASRVC